MSCSDEKPASFVKPETVMVFTVKMEDQPISQVIPTKISNEAARILILRNFKVLSCISDRKALPE
jgi:hypothetical protein